MSQPVTLTVNGKENEVSCGATTTLLTVLRDTLALTGSKRGCNQGVCGACTVLVDGTPVRACLTLAANTEGQSITTIEGLPDGGDLKPIQQAIIDSDAVQCGFCTSGMILTAHEFLQRNSNPSIDDIRTALSGNICRCSGYRKIVDAVALAASRGGA
ncbi:(2Fe-2S)-binding protein [Hwanghaeella sp. LZ110]|uniref:(2Fe-2S)-binding protein n=1 Tax=Hwanghaeella sp. LZ110 TaxID=3402810 RepID=UPI003B67E5E7